MKKKIIIIAVVLIIAIIAYLIYTKNAETKAQNEQLANDLDKALKSAGNGYYGSAYTDDSQNNPSSNPQHQLTTAKVDYQTAAKEIFGLFDGFTSDEDEEAVKNIIRDIVHTDADWKELRICYGTDSSGMGLVQRCIDEDISRNELNQILQNAGCTVRV